MRKAVLFTVFNRVDYLKKTLESWSNVDLIKDYDFCFYVEPSDVFKQITDLIYNFEDKTKINFSIHYNEKILGTGGNTWRGFTDSFKKYDFVVLAEDDVIVSKDVLKYFDAAEKMYRDDDEIAVISANTKWDTTDPTGVVREQGFNGLVWGTWKKYWDNYFGPNWDKDYSSDLIHNGWDWHLNLRIMPNNNLKNINPLVSRSNHIGIKGMHCDENVFDITQSPSFKEENDWLFIKEVKV